MSSSFIEPKPVDTIPDEVLTQVGDALLSITPSGESESGDTETVVLFDIEAAPNQPGQCTLSACAVSLEPDAGKWR